MLSPGFSKTSERKQQLLAEGPSHELAGQPVASGRHADILGLQRASGNRAVSQLVQPDIGGPPPAADGVPPIIDDVLKSGGGQPLDPATRGEMEHHFGEDFSGVRVHADAQSAASAEAMKANAYTVGRDMVFGAGKYQPTSGSGKRLLAHELAHVVQQRGAAVASEPLNIPSDPFEQAAEAAATQVAFGASTAAAHTVAGAPPAVQLQAQNTVPPRARQLRVPVPQDVRTEMKRQIEELREHWHARLLPLVGSQIDIVVSLIWEYASKGRDAASGGRGAPGDWADTFVELMLITTYDRGVAFSDWTSLFDDTLQSASRQQRADIRKYLARVGSRYAAYEPPRADEEPSLMREVISPVAWKALELFSLGIVDESLFDLSREALKQGPEYQVLVICKVVGTRVFNILSWGGGIPAYEAVVRYWDEHPNDGPWTTLAGAIVAGGVAAFKGIRDFFLPIQELLTSLAGQQIADPKTGVLRDPSKWERIEAFFGAIIKVLALAGAGKALKARLGPGPKAPAGAGAGEIAGEGKGQQAANTGGPGQDMVTSPGRPPAPTQPPPATTTAETGAKIIDLTKHLPPRPEGTAKPNAVSTEAPLPENNVVPLRPLPKATPPPPESVAAEQPRARTGTDNQPVRSPQGIEVSTTTSETTVASASGPGGGSGGGPSGPPPSLVGGPASTTTPVSTGEGTQGAGKVGSSAAPPVKKLPSHLSLVPEPVAEAPAAKTNPANVKKPPVTLPTATKAARPVIPGTGNPGGGRVDVSGNYRYRSFSKGGTVYREASGPLGHPDFVEQHRSRSAQREVAGGTGDDAGHQIGNQFGASGGSENLELQNRPANQFGTWKNLESRWAVSLRGGTYIEVTVTDITRPGETRPFMRRAEWVEIAPDGTRTTHSEVFGNNYTPEGRALQSVPPIVTNNQTNNVVPIRTEDSS